jgi:hypothetical protein
MPVAVARAKWGLICSLLLCCLVLQVGANSTYAAIPAQAAGSYTCQARPAPADRPTPPPLPTPPASLDGYQVAPKSQAPLCPEGQVPQFTGTATSAQAVPPNPTGYSHEYGYQGPGATPVPFDTSGLAGYTGQEEPTLDPSDPSAHSIDQLWLIDPNTKSDVEYGWTVDRGLNGNAQPHLFIYRFDGGSPTCYNTGVRYGCPTATHCSGRAGAAHGNGWVQESSTEAPGEALGVNPYLDQYAAVDYGGNWWILHDSTWLGYYPTCAWATHITGIPVNEAGGEVYSKGSPYCINSAMGNSGSGATNPNADLWLGLEQEITTSGENPTGVAAAQMTGENDDLGTQYSIGQYSPSNGHASQFRFGGPAC